jgi:hypothetical protein
VSFLIMILRSWCRSEAIGTGDRAALYQMALALAQLITEEAAPPAHLWEEAAPVRTFDPHRTEPDSTLQEAASPVLIPHRDTFRIGSRPLLMSELL